MTGYLWREGTSGAVRNSPIDLLPLQAVASVHGKRANDYDRSHEVGGWRPRMQQAWVVMGSLASPAVDSTLYRCCFYPNWSVHPRVVTHCEGPDGYLTFDSPSRMKSSTVLQESGECQGREDPSGCQGYPDRGLNDLLVCGYLTADRSRFEFVYHAGDLIHLLVLVCVVQWVVMMRKPYPEACCRRYRRPVRWLLMLDSQHWRRTGPRRLRRQGRQNRFPRPCRRPSR